MSTKDPREDKLPRWAQTILSQQRGRIESLERQVVDKRSKEKPAIAVLDPYDAQIPVAYSGDDTIAFSLNSDFRHDPRDLIYVTRTDDGHLRLLSVNGPLIIQTEASIVVKIRTAH